MILHIIYVVDRSHLSKMLSEVCANLSVHLTFLREAQFFFLCILCFAT
jgi:hypothetical protein